MFLEHANPDDAANRRHSPENSSVPYQFFDSRDLLQVVYQTATALQLQQGFPSATAYLKFRWSEFRAMKGVISAGIVGCLGIIYRTHLTS